MTHVPLPGPLSVLALKGRGDRHHSDWNVGKSLTIPPSLRLLSCIFVVEARLLVGCLTRASVQLKVSQILLIGDSGKG